MSQEQEQKQRFYFNWSLTLKTKSCFFLFHQKKGLKHFNLVDTAKKKFPYKILLFLGGGSGKMENSILFF